MTRGEKVAWIWVWSAIALLTVGLSFALWRYWSLPADYLDAQLCAKSNDGATLDACERLLSYEQATTEARSIALRKLAKLATGRKQRDVAIQQFTSLIQLGTATSDDWNQRGMNYLLLDDYEKALGSIR